MWFFRASSHKVFAFKMGLHFAQQTKAKPGFVFFSFNCCHAATFHLAQNVKPSCKTSYRKSKPLCFGCSRKPTAGCKALLYCKRIFKDFFNFFQRFKKENKASANQNLPGFGSVIDFIHTVLHILNFNVIQYRQ